MECRLQSAYYGIIVGIGVASTIFEPVAWADVAQFPIIKSVIIEITAVKKKILDLFMLIPLLFVVVKRIFFKFKLWTRCCNWHC